MSNLLWLPQEQRLESPEEFRERIKQDLLISKQELEDAFGIEVASYAYPFSDYGQDTLNFPGVAGTVAEVVESIYPMMFYQVSHGDISNHPDQDAFMVKRIRVSPEWTDADLLSVLDSGTL